MSIKVFGEAPYYSDYDVTKGFQRILFKPGVAVQARELTQIQEILQEQINRQAANIFKDGSLVTGGQTQYDMRGNFIVILKTVGADPVDTTAIVGKDLIAETADTNGIKATCKVVLLQETASNYVLIVKATNGGIFLANDNLQYQPDPNVSGTNFATIAATSFFGKASTFSVNDGIFYTKGSFVLANKTTVVMAKDTNTIDGSAPSVRVGLDIVESVVDSDDDSTLLDPALGSYNYNAPGADRYKIALNLAAHPFLRQATVQAIVNDGTGAITSIQIIDGGSGYSTDNFISTIVTVYGSTLDSTGNGATAQVTSVDPDSGAITSVALTNGGSGFTSTSARVVVAEPVDDVTDFIELARFDQGTLVGLVDTSAYAVIGDTMARRTYDESGSYTVVPYVIRTSDKVGNPDKFVLNIDPGKSYVQGFELKNIATVRVDSDRARDAGSQAPIDGYNLNSYYGNYTLVEFDAIVGVFDPTTFPALTIKDVGNNTIGSADLVAISYYDSTPLVYKFHLGNVQITDNTKSFADAFTLVDGSNVATLTLIDGKATLQDTSSASLLFILPQQNVKTVSDSLDFSYKVLKTATVASGAATITQTGGIQLKQVSDSPADKGNGYVIYDTTAGTALDMTAIDVATTFNGSTAAATFTGAPLVDGHNLSVIATLQADNVARMSKTKVTGHTYSATPSPGDRTIILDVWDGLNLTSVVDGSAIDYTARFIFDNGERDERYDYARLVLKPGEIMPAGPLTITMDYFSHGSTGGYFSVDSYADYTEIPVYVDKKNNSIPLQNALDFRYSPAATNPTVPDGLDEIVVDLVHYLGRIDRLILSPTGEFNIIKGLPALNPQTPAGDSVSMTIATMTIAPYTANLTQDVKLTLVDNKRYTMRDIGVLDSRISRLEYYNALNLLEKSATDLLTLDVNGNDRFKNGVLVDSFSSMAIADVYNADYYAGINTAEQFCTCPTITDTERARLDWSTRNDVSLRNDLLSLSYSTTPFISQGKASRAISVNPFNVTVFNGKIDMNPPSDIWYDVTKLPDIVINNLGENDQYDSASQGDITPTTAGQVSYGNWQFNWFGTPNQYMYPGDLVTANAQGTGTHLDQSGFLNIPPQGRRGTTTSGPSTTVPLGPPAPATLTRTITSTTTTFQTINQSAGDRIVNVSVIPFMRTISLYFASTGLKPTTVMYPFFDDQAQGANVERAEVLKVTQQVSGQAIPTIVAFQNAVGMAKVSQNQGGTVVTGTVIMCRNGYMHIARDGSTPFSASYDIEFQWTISDDAGNTTNFNARYDVDDVSVAVAGDNGSGMFRTDVNGGISGIYTVPAETFHTGDRKFRLIDNTDDNAALAATFADYTFSSFGLKLTTQTTYIATRVPITTTQTSTQTQQVYWDPVAESFLVDATIHPNGVFLDSVDLFFQNEDTALPVSVQLRPMVNGVPSSTDIIPGSVVELDASLVNVTTTDDATLVPSLSDPNTKTNFKFANPIHLMAGLEYAIVVMSNSDAYEVYIADIGSTQLGSTQKISEQPYAGSLFESQNASTWTPTQTSDLMFQLNRCEFDTSGSCELVVFGYEGGDDFNYDLLNVSGNNIEFANVTDLEWGYKLVDAPNVRETVFTDFLLNNDNYLPQRSVLKAFSGTVALVSSQTVYTVPFNAVQETTDTLEVYLADTKLDKANYTIRPKVGGGPNDTEFVWRSLTNALPSSGTLTFYSLSGTKLSVSMATTDTKVSPIVDLQELGFTMIQNQIDNASIKAASFSLPSDTDLPTPKIVLTSTGGGTGAILLCVMAENILQSVTITNGGTGYSNGTLATVSSTQSPSPTVTATLTLTVNAGIIIGYTITNPGSGYDTPTMVIDSAVGTGASVYPIVTQTDQTVEDSGTVTGFLVVDGGSGYTDEWTATMIRPDDATVSLVVHSETEAPGGNATARYISRRVTLVDGFDAEDIQVFLTGMSPIGTSLDVYYRVLAAADGTQFEDRPWVKMVQGGTATSNNLTDYYELQYATVDGQISYGGFTSFKQYAIKVVMSAVNDAQVPRFSQLRAIALDTAYNPV